MVLEFFLLFFAQFEVAFFEFEFAQGELVCLFCAVGFGLFALAALFFAVFVALFFGAGVDGALGLTFFALLFAQLAAGLCGDFALLARVAGVGAFHHAVEADDLFIGFYPGFLGECCQC